MKEQWIEHTVHTAVSLRNVYRVHGGSVVEMIEEQTAEIHIKGMADRDQSQKGKTIDPGNENDEY